MGCLLLDEILGWGHPRQLSIPKVNRSKPKPLSNIAFRNRRAGIEVQITPGALPPQMPGMPYAIAFIKHHSVIRTVRNDPGGPRTLSGGQNEVFASRLMGTDSTGELY